MSPTQGIYYPGMPRDTDAAYFLKSLDRSKPSVGLLIGQGSWINGDLELPDKLIEKIENKGANVIPAFFTPAADPVTGSRGVTGPIEDYFMENGRTIIESLVICGFGFSLLALSDPTDGTGKSRRNIFEELNVPVIAGISLTQSEAEWRENPLGMSGSEIAVSIAMPECDGQLTTVPYSFREVDENGGEHRGYVGERLERIAGIAVNWARIGRIPVHERRVSIILNGGKTTNANLGNAGGMDAFESLKNILARLKKEGYKIDRVPESGQEIIDEMLGALTNNLEWNTDEDIREKAIELLDTEYYRKWTESIPDASNEWVCRNWGNPPGEIMSFEGKFIIPGVMNGNVYLGMEPDRGTHTKAEQLIHDPYLSPPHFYTAYYRWLSKIFKTDINVHLGTHGTVEWLPGKSNALSEECFPEIMMEDIPCLYPYVINDPSEGIVAKRRKRSVLVDYLMPALTRADTYEDLADLESSLQQYLSTKQARQTEKIEITGTDVYDRFSKLSMWKELDLEENAPMEDVLAVAEEIFDYVSELKDGLITDGLHVMGQVPEGRHLNEMVYCLTRLRNGKIPSLRKSIAENRGYDLDVLLDKISEFDAATGKLNGTLVDEIDTEFQNLIESYASAGFEKEECMRIARSAYGEDEDIFTVTEYICDTLYVNICGIEDEIENLVNGMNGGYVPPGPSGAPTRGNAHLLPTGKNFYSLDPETIPSEASWKMGIKMADQMIDAYMKKEGTYPESVGIVIWSIDTMKTGGDDIGYILYLMGVRPVWGSLGGKVVGLEIIPLDELGRPRLDVTVRMSSLFRDTFPNVFKLIDEAVLMVAELDEDEEKNYIVKHHRKEMAEMVKEGMSPAEAKDLSLIRVFGEPPCTYGAGVEILVESSKWDSVSDLADIYISHGCSAYGIKWRGETKPELFRHRLENLNVAVKNQTNREIDMIDIDDGYVFLGGINAVVRASGKEKPMNFVADTSDPDRIKTRSLEGEISYILRSRLLNPKWIDGLKEHGFVGANLVSDNISYMYGWDATSDVIEKWMYDSVTDHFLINDENREWIKENNPYAFRDILGTLLEAIERDMWEAYPETEKLLKEMYLEAEGILEEIAANDS